MPARQEPGGGVAPLGQARHEHLVAAKAIAQPFHGGDDVGELIEPARIGTAFGETPAGARRR